MELLVVVLILTIIFSWTMPGLKQRLTKTKQDLAVQTMLKDVQYLERWYSVCGSYARDLNSNSLPPCYTNKSLRSDLSWPGLPYTMVPESGHLLYRIKFSAVRPSYNATSSATSNYYHLVAIPLCNANQEDLPCVCVDQDSNIINHTNNTCTNNLRCECTN